MPSPATATSAEPSAVAAAAVTKRDRPEDRTAEPGSAEARTRRRARSGAAPGGRAEPRGQLGDRRLARRRRRRLRWLGPRQRHAGGIVIGGQHVPAARVENPLGDVQPAAGNERELHLPVSVAALLGVPLSVFRVNVESGQPLGNHLAQPRARSRRGGIALAAYQRSLCLLRYVSAFGQDRALEPAHALDGDAGRVRDFLDSFPGADSCLDLLGSQRALHFDFVLSEPGGLAERHRPEALVYRQREARAPSRYCEHSVTAILAHRDEAQFLHRRPFRPGPFTGFHGPVQPPSAAVLPGAFPAYSSRAADPETPNHSIRGARNHSYLHEVWRVRYAMASTAPGMSGVNPAICGHGYP